MKYLKYFKTNDDYNLFISSDAVSYPNVSLVVNHGVKYHKLPNGYIQLATIDGEIIYDSASRKLLILK